jgi:hypothetical protein
MTSVPPGRLIRIGVPPRHVGVQPGGGGRGSGARAAGQRESAAALVDVEREGIRTGESPDRDVHAGGKLGVLLAGVADSGGLVASARGRDDEVRVAQAESAPQHGDAVDLDGHGPRIGDRAERDLHVVPDETTGAGGRRRCRR